MRTHLLRLATAASCAATVGCVDFTGLGDIDFGGGSFGGGGFDCCAVPTPPFDFSPNGRVRLLVGDTVVFVISSSVGISLANWTTQGAALRIVEGDSLLTASTKPGGTALVRVVAKGVGQLTASSATSNHSMTHHFTAIDSAAVWRVSLGYSSPVSVARSDSVPLHITLVDSTNTPVWGRPILRTSDSTRARIVRHAFVGFEGVVERWFVIPLDTGDVVAHATFGSLRDSVQIRIRP